LLRTAIEFIVEVRLKDAARLRFHHDGFNLVSVMTTPTSTTGLFLSSKSTGRLSSVVAKPFSRHGDAFSDTVEWKLGGVTAISNLYKTSWECEI
jgi:hypothetical protein